jgi:predicted dehydrogenase
MTPQLDTLTAKIDNHSPLVEKMPKTRPDDFIIELRHIEAALASDWSKSPIALSRGLDTMLVLAATHLSHQTGRTVSIDYSAGPTPDALSLV